MTNKKIRVLIIDDEPLARKRIRHLLEEDPSFETIGECEDGLSAVVRIMEDLNKRVPDYLWLSLLMEEPPPAAAVVDSTTEGAVACTPQEPKAERVTVEGNDDMPVNALKADRYELTTILPTSFSADMPISVRLPKSLSRQGSSIT